MEDNNKNIYAGRCVREHGLIHMERGKRSVLLIVLLVSLLSSSVGLSQDTRKVLSAYFAEVRAGHYQTIPKHLSLPEEAKNTLAAIAPYLSDSTAAVRVKAYSIVQLVGAKARQEHVRQDAVSKLVQGLKDSDGGNAGSALGYLDGFYKKDFSASARDTVASLFQRGMAHYDKLIRLVGFLDIRSLQTPLRTLAQQSDIPKKDRWAATLALARMGDSYAVENMMKRVRRLPVTDEVVYEIFPDLVYTRRREALEWMLDALHSDVKNCSSADAESSVKIPCAYRIMEILAPAIQNYPLTVDETGDVVSDSYTAALQTVREWFKKNPQYVIITDRQ